LRSSSRNPTILRLKPGMIEGFLAGHANGRRRVEQSGQELFGPARDPGPSKIGAPPARAAPKPAIGPADVSCQLLLLSKPPLGRCRGGTRIAVLVRLSKGQFSGETTIQNDPDTPHVRCETRRFPQEHLGGRIIEAAVPRSASAGGIALSGCIGNRIVYYHKRASQIAELQSLPAVVRRFVVRLPPPVSVMAITTSTALLWSQFVAVGGRSLVSFAVTRFGGVDIVAVIMARSR